MRYVMIYGVLSGAIVVAVIVAGLAFDLPSHLQSMWFGYLIMVTALSLIFVGIKRYRDLECGGVVRFGRAFAVGLGIAAVAGAVYVAGWEAYLATAGQDFMAEYTAGVLAEMRASGASAAELAKAQADMAWAVELYRHPLQRMVITFTEIFPVGLVVALVSAAALRNPRVFPVRAS
ncbi:MAG: hypothetical protein B7Z33_13380 [Sphingomonadales bacterium 12-68-11]|nr:MAG: hypothetical protein B7Z33_13380 [Sphingomonadales bacterium 12-68-11]OYX16769.1 MAG: hypothetical protein B7Z07_01965 [Sphingomonadales bacterium 32-67-7]